MISTEEKLRYLEENPKAPLAFFVVDSPATEPAPGAAIISCVKCGDLYYFSPGQLFRAEQYIESRGGAMLVMCKGCAASEGVSAASTTPTLIGHLKSDGKITS